MKSVTDGTTDFGTYLRRLREQRGLSLRQVSIKSGVSNAYISQLENTKRIPSARVLSKLAPVYRVDAATLFEEAGLVPKKGTGLKVTEKKENYRRLPPGLRELTEDRVIMEHFQITPFEITRLAEFQFKRNASPKKEEFLLLIFFLRGIQA